ncbi:hypothetical protein [Rubrivivax gelatinosus]|uniref:hypothetical protein n=1 Tax=Rubrivivax gelatinosus TaxID=28068 RepID=UPI0003177888|nr:hypothetical protein [Rubrivivax gelatinosus]MBG6083057.1 hypothetical protein [Rubrivivax gelatinosus]
MDKIQEALNPEHPAYLAEPRRGWGNYTRRVSVLSVTDASDGRRLLKRFMPGLSAEVHRAIADGHVRKAQEHQALWAKNADEAMVETFARPFRVHDYRVSGIAREEFSDERKNVLRMCARRGSEHHRLAILHYMAAGHCHRKALQICRTAGL